MRIRLWKTLLLLACGLAASSAVQAGCVAVSNTPPFTAHLNIAIPPIPRDRVMAAGTVFYDSNWLSVLPGGQYSMLDCHIGTRMAWGVFSRGMTPVSVPGYSSVYATNVPGVGMQIAYHYYHNEPLDGLYFVDGNIMNPAPSYVYANGWYRVRLLATGGSIGSGPIDLAGQSADVWFGDPAAGKVNTSRLVIDNSPVIPSSSCTVSNTTLTLPTVTTADLAAGPAGSTNFNVAVQCPSQAGIQVAYHLDATPPAGFDSSSGLLALAAGSSASGVAVQLLSRLSSPAAPITFGLAGKQVVTTTSVVNQMVNIPLTARYVQTESSMRAGTVVGVASVSMYYE